MATQDPNEMSGFTIADALTLVAAYFDVEWAATSLEDVQMHKVTGGTVNRLHLLKRTSTAENEPSAVLIRHFGLGHNAFLEDPPGDQAVLSSAEQALIYYEMGRRGWGPKVYGLFPGGRLEEYIDAHTLTAAEASEPSIRRDLARSFARLHSLQLPFKKNNFRLVADELRKATIERIPSAAQTLIRSENSKSTELGKVLSDASWHLEIDWVAGLLEEHQCKRTLAVSDTNFLNVLVKNYESECRTVLIDYETCTYSYRGMDIGGHFTDRMFCWSNAESNLTGFDAPGVDEQRSFCRAYLDEMRALGQRLTSSDTEDHLLMEARIGGMWQILFSVMLCFVVSDLPDDPILHEGFVYQLKRYWQLRQEWNSWYQPSDQQAVAHQDS